MVKTDAIDAGAVHAALNSLMGIVSGIVCDDQLGDGEVRFLARWLAENAEITTVFPANIISRRVSDVMSDGVLTDDEKAWLLADLKMLSSPETASARPALPPHIAAAFAPGAVVNIPARIFVLTGEFVFGSRSACERAILRRGGSVGSSVSLRTDYIVVGDLTTAAWLQENFDRKIQQAVNLSKSGQAHIAVVHEADWAAALN